MVLYEINKSLNNIMHTKKLFDAKEVLFLQDPKYQDTENILNRLVPGYNKISLTELFISPDKLYKPNGESLSLEEIKLIIFAPGLNYTYKHSLIKVLKHHYPEILLRNIDTVPYSNWHWENKFELFSALIHKSVETVKLPQTYVINPQATKEITQQFRESVMPNFPFVLKAALGSQGKSVKKINNAPEFNIFLDSILNIEGFDSKRNYYLMQEMIYSPMRSDYRIIAIQGKIIGGMERISNKKDEFRTNFSLGGDIRKMESIPEDIEDAVKEIYEKTRLTTIGFDFIRDNNSDLYLLEITTAPQRDGFNSLHGFDALEIKLLKLLERDQLRTINYPVNFS